VAAPTEIPVGIITALFGAPYFIMLVARGRKRGMSL
jgi:iron complex transport system permease protein